MQLNVREIHQNAGGGSYVVIFNATVVPNDSCQVTVRVDVVEPADTAAELVELALRGIREGVEYALKDRSMGADVCVDFLGINFRDFKPMQFKIHAAAGLDLLLRQGDRGVVV